MKITIIAVGKIKEKPFEDVIGEYSKCLSRYRKFETLQTLSEKTPDNANETVGTQIKEREGERILSRIPEGAYAIALAIEGKMLDSEELAEEINTPGITGTSQIVFIAGDSLGLSGQVLECADYRLSFSRMTFPHQPMRAVLLGQVYRGYWIVMGTSYHK